MSSHSVSAVTVQVKYLSVGIILHISRAVCQIRVIVTCAVCCGSLCQVFIKVVLKYRLCLCVFSAYFHLYCNLRTAHSKLFIRKVQHRSSFRIKEYGFYISVAACVIQRIAAVSRMFLCRTRMVYDYKVAILVCCK